MATHAHPDPLRSDIGQVVRCPSPADGVGRALRDVFARDGRLPGAWSDCLRRIDERTSR